MVEGECDAVDLNLGCPQRIARRGGYGAFLMDDLSSVESIVSTLAQGLSIPVTCKIRVFPDLERTLEYARMLERAQCAMLAVHGRTRDQKDNNATRADWDAISAVKNAVTIPVLANGNIRDLEDVRRCLEYTGADGVLSAQSLLENPALFDEKCFQLDSTADPLRGCRLLREYLQLAVQHPVPNRMMKTHVYRLLGDWFSEFTDIREQLNRDRSSSFQECLNFLSSIADAVERRIAASGRDHPIPVPIERKSAIERQERIQAAREEQRREEESLAEIGVKVQ
ncbi:unnamed protein product [Ostreobium quekettii]|uniref:tRNA-dihydrouridine(16/17) synthase [NAD(P)(+)] n=1 Tax=Ostreobium quekettii TaxID=121088 RepID=A0A8S1J437_9CHLO|nr:unnamed protein product [Ostreobium quekettii]